MEERRLVEVWLTREEGQDARTEARLRPLCRSCREQNYLVAVYRSGEGELFGLTRSLLLQNRDPAAPGRKEEDLLSGSPQSKIRKQIVRNTGEKGGSQ